MPRLSIGLEQVFTNLGIVGDGYKLFFFDTGTMIPKTTYSNEGLTVQNTNPVVLNEAGRPDVSIWGSDPSLYRMILGTPDSVLGNITTIVDVDPVDNYSVDNIAGLTPIPTAYWGTTAGTSAHYTLDPALVDITSYSNTQTFFIDFHIACAAAPDININDLGALNLKKYTGQGTKVALLVGDVQAQRHLCIDDGTDIVVLNPRTQMQYLGIPPTITIILGTATLPNSTNNYIFDGEGALADTLDSINGLVDGQEITFQIASAARPITISLSGNILTPFGETTVINSTSIKVKGIFRSSDSKLIIELISGPRIYNTSTQVITFGGQLLLPHGLAKIPDLIRFTLINVNAEGGYTTGIILSQNPGYSDGGTGPRGISAIIDATNITIRFGSSGISVIRQDTGANLDITAANWTLGVRAFLLT